MIDCPSAYLTWPFDNRLLRGRHFRVSPNMKSPQPTRWIRTDITLDILSEIFRGTARRDRGASFSGELPRQENRLCARQRSAHARMKPPRTPGRSDALMRISSHGRASKRGRKTLYNVCVRVYRGTITCISHCKQGPCRLHRSCTRKHDTRHKEGTRVRARDMHARREYVRLRKLESRRIPGVCRLGSLTRRTFNVRARRFLSAALAAA